MMRNIFALCAVGTYAPTPHASPFAKASADRSRRPLGGLALLLVLILAIPSVEAAGPRVPTQKVMQDGCIKSGGTWRILPPECDNMHPRSWAKLTPEQQQNCMASFNEPCECGSGKRFIYMGKVACEKSNFPSDK